MIQRHISGNLDESLADTPVALLTGARQTGKTTLAMEWAGRRKARYFTLDEAATLAGAASDPQGFIENLEQPAVIDEVQKVPALLPAIKLRVDRDRRPGMFLLTGSANVLTLPKVSESLAGRMEIHRLWPLSQGEIHGRHEDFIATAFSKRPPRAVSNGLIPLARPITVGGYPEVQKRKGNRSAAWFGSYISALLQRDVRDLAHVERLTSIPNLLTLLATRSACLLNTSDLTRDARIANSTLKRYLSLLEMIFIAYRLPAWSVNLGKRLVKAPKLMLCDTGLACHLLGADENRLNGDATLKGRLTENFISNELHKQATWSAVSVRIFHFRSASAQEIDFILEDTRGRVVAIEVKASHTVRPEDFHPMRALAESLKSRFIRGILLHDGRQVIPHGANLWSAPFSCLWSAGES